MKKKKVWIIASLLCVVTFAAGVTGYIVSVNNRVQNRFSSLMRDRGISAAVYAVHQGKVIADTGAGNATAEQKNTSETAYGIASLTKQFTAAAVMQLYDEGKIDVEDKLSKYFPEYRYGDIITLKQLLSHRSGIPDFSVDNENGTVIVSCYGTEEDGFSITDKNTAEENRELIRKFFFSKSLLFAPGAAFHYSDSNFMLLAEIVEKVSGMGFHEYVRQHIFAPLQMEHSAFIDDYDDSIGATIAEADPNDFGENYYHYKGVEFGCGDILTTPQDLYLWYKGLTSGEVVSDNAYRMMTENYSQPGELGYGFGLMISDEGDSKVVYHYGYIPSYYSSLIYIPEYDYFEAVIANRKDGDSQQLAADMAKYFGSTIGLNLANIG